MVIDLTGLTKPTIDEPEKLYCKYCRSPNGGGVELLYCNHSKEEDEAHAGCKQPGMSYHKGDYQCPSCGNVKTVQYRKTKEQKGPKLASSRHSSTPQGFIGILSTHPDAFELNSDREELYPDIDDEDSVYEDMGANIAETTTFYPESGRTLTRKPEE
jgi:ribosomal protein L37E